MKLGKSVQIVLELTAMGGVFLVLSGSALAADGGSATTTQTSAVPISTGQVVEAVAGEVETVTPTVETKAPAAETVPGVDSDKTAPKADGQTGTVSTASGQETQTVSNPVLDDDATKAKTSLSATLASPDTAVSAQDSQEKAAGQPPADNKPPVIKLVTASGTTIPTTERLIRPAALRPSIVYRSTTLKIQPTITSHATAPVNDLAAMMPSAPAPAKAPVPAKTSGLFGALTAELAGIVVPQPFVPVPVPVVRALLAMLLVVLVMPAMRTFGFSYASLVRRGGFATAPRSDSPADGLLPQFATPLLLGYESVPPHRHSPVFYGSRVGL